MNTCPYCLQDFTPPSKHPGQKHCSTTCRDKARSTRKILPCSICGTLVERQAKRYNRQAHLFCSKACEAEGRRRWNPRGSSHPQYVEPVIVTCETCGVTLSRLPCKVKRHNFCNPTCRLIWQKTSGYISGDKSPTWLGGCEDYRGPNWGQQSKAARKRDNHTCQRCGITETELQKLLDVHHIIPYRTFLGDWLRANQLDNLVSLCPSCHQIEENLTGSKAAFSSKTARRARAAQA